LKIVLIAFFGVIGVLARYGLNVVFYRGASSGFPMGTFVINLLGCFLIGIIYVLGLEKNIISAEFRLALMTGLLGGFTTFSAYSLETALLFNAQEYFLGGLYFLLSGVLGLAFTYAGFFTARLMT